MSHMSHMSHMTDLLSVLDWLARNWGWLLASIVLAGYFSFYVLAMREQRTSAIASKPRLPCDRC